MISRIEIMVIRWAQMPGPSSHTEENGQINHCYVFFLCFLCSHLAIVWAAPFDVSPVFVFLAPLDAGLEKVMLTLTFPEHWDGDGKIHFLVINFLSLGTSATTLMKRGSRLLLSISFRVSLTFWICMTSVSVVCWIVWHDLSSPFSLEVRICLRLVPCPLAHSCAIFLFYLGN